MISGAREICYVLLHLECVFATVRVANLGAKLNIKGDTTKEAKQAATDRLSNLVKSACLNTSSVCIPILFDQTMVEVALTMIEDGSLHGSNHLWDLFVTTQLGLKQGSPLQAVVGFIVSKRLRQFVATASALVAHGSKCRNMPVQRISETKGSHTRAVLIPLMCGPRG